MKHNNDFKYDLKVGQVGEKQLASLLEDTKIEVKKDLQAIHTGNVFVEYNSRGELSGLSTTEADWYAFILSIRNIVLIKTSLLKDKCRKYHNTKRDVVGGDNNTSKGILLPITELL